jgi:hypothetical protein
VLKLRFNQVVVAGAFLSSVFFANAFEPRALGLNNEGCVGSRQTQALDRLRERLPPSNPVVVLSSVACEPSNYRCDGGFVWLPYMVNVERSWVLYTLPRKGNWVGVSLRNICTNRKVLRGDFLNEPSSPYVDRGAAYAVGWALDDQQDLYQGYENLAIRLARPNGEYLVGIYGLDEAKMQSTLLDSFTVSPL